MTLGSKGWVGMCLQVDAAILLQPLAGVIYGAVSISCVLMTRPSVFCFTEHVGCDRST